VDKNKEFLNLILDRRSCRTYRPDPLPKALLAAIVEAGRYAPSGMNRQMNRFYIITDPKVLTAISQTVSRRLEHFAGKDCRYNAPALILVTNSRQNPSAIQDASCAMENMMLAAASLGVGSRWINQPYHLRDDEEMLALLSTIGVGEEELVCASLSVGYPEGELFPGRRERTGNEVIWVCEN